MQTRKRTSKKEAWQFLQDVPEDKKFWVNNGPVIKNMHELAVALAEMTDEQYKFHANPLKNDFSNWVRDIIGDKNLAEYLIHARNRESAKNKVEKRIELLKNMIK